MNEYHYYNHPKNAHAHSRFNSVKWMKTEEELVGSTCLAKGMNIYLFYEFQLKLSSIPGNSYTEACMKRGSPYNKVAEG